MGKHDADPNLMETPETTRFQKLTTADPQQYAFRIWVPDTLLNDGMLPARGTAYKDTRLPKEQTSTNGHGDYVLVDTEDGPNNMIGFVFVKPRTAEERKRPTPVETWWDYQVYTWPWVLEGLHFVTDRNAPNTVRNANGNVTVIDPMLATPVLTPQTTANCQVKVEVFQDSKPFSGVHYPRPVSGDVQWNFGSAGGASLPPCLHPEIRIARPSYYRTLSTDATPGFTDAPGGGRYVIFPATRFRTWRPFVLSATPGRKNGAYTLTRATIYPPPKPKPVML